MPNEVGVFYNPAPRSSVLTGGRFFLITTETQLHYLSLAKPAPCPMTFGRL
jgi:hypothetical protein